MDKIGFIGAYDKTDLILYIAKILTILKKKVLIVDTTINQKAKYVIPAINPTLKYITDFEGIDIAVGFANIEEIKQYLGVEEQQEMEYDIVFYDTDNAEGINNFNIDESRQIFFVTSFDNYSLKRGLEALTDLKQEISMTKILFSQQILKEDDDYLNFLSTPYKINWNEHRINFPIENGDLTVIRENQRVAKIKFRKLSVAYKDGLVHIVERILEDVSESNIRRVVKIIEKGA